MKLKKGGFFIAAGLVVVSCIVLAWWFFAGSSGEEVVFIPGWQTQFDSPDLYRKHLKIIYPKAKITILNWESSCPWDTAKNNAAKFVPEVVKYIAGKSQKAQRRLILIGHSLGSRIAVDTAWDLAKKKVKISQYILLGAAMDSRTKVRFLAERDCLNIFCRGDDTLKLIYSNSEGHLAAGFCGLDHPPKQKFKQYEIRSSIKEKTNGVKIFNHTAETYFSELKLAVDGKLAPYRQEYVYSVKPGRLDIPQKWFIPLDMFDYELLDTHAGWKLVRPFRRKNINWKEIDSEDKNLGEKLRKTFSYAGKYIVEILKDKVFAIADHNGRIVCPAFSRERWEKIKTQISKCSPAEDGKNTEPGK